MKRIIAIALVVMMIAALFAACGSTSPEGKYVVKSIDGKSVQEALDESAKAAGVSADDLLKQLGIDKMEEIVTLELKSDGTAVMDVKLFNTSTEGKWEQNGDKISITMNDDGNGGETSTFTLKGNELSNDEGDQKYIFIKK